VSLATGSRLGPYEVLASIGAGGMGEVYRARDARLDRDVAIKVLPAAFAQDADRLGRFEREAKAIAALSHPNVLAVFDTGTHDGQVFVVTELLQGQTLRELISAGGLPVRKTIDAAIQISRGLAAAHEKGIVHRDLKPDNLFMCTDGHVKILDFGLAKAMDSGVEGGADDATRTMAMTDPGTVMGTVGYMAPEQVRGQAVDARADLFALGAVVYEMLTGTRAFQRDTAAETMTAILKDDPPEASVSRAEVSSAFDRIIRHCLEKNLAERFQSARDVAFALGSLSGSEARGSSGTAAIAPSRWEWLTRERIMWAVLVLTLGVAVAWLGWMRPPDTTASTFAVRATIPLPAGVGLMQGVAGRRFQISPDGTHLAFVGMSASSGETLYLQPLDELSARRIEGTPDAFGPFWSPDSGTVAFRSRDRLMKVAVGGGPPTEIAATRAVGAWGADNAILTAAFLSAGQMGLRLLRPGGAEPTDLFPPVSEAAERFVYPFFLPDGQTFLFGYAVLQDTTTAGIYWARVGESGKHLITPLKTTDSMNAFVASGYLLWARDRMVMAQPFDSRRMQLSGEAVPLVGPVQANVAGEAGAAFSVSQNGVLVYQPAATEGDATRLLWFDRSGEPLGTLADEADYSNLEFSPDGSRLAVSVTDAAVHTRDIWVVDVARGIRSRVTFDPSDERSAVWSADGRDLMYNSKGLDLYSKAIGTGAEQPVVVDGVSKDPRGVLADGTAIYRATGRSSGNDVWVKLPGEAPKPFLNTPFDENYGSVSPDGKWMAYVSDETGAYEVYVTAFPSGQGKWQISNRGGSLPRWRHDGRELFYLSTDLNLFAVKVTTTAGAFVPGTAERLFQTAAVTTPGSSYDVTPDGRRFLVNTAIPSGIQPSLVVLSNWPALIKKLP
jgi:eukaryotic-like serine/threonine-protein kinase